MAVKAVVALLAAAAIALPPAGAAAQPLPGDRLIVPDRKSGRRSWSRRTRAPWSAHSASPTRLTSAATALITVTANRIRTGIHRTSWW